MIELCEGGDKNDEESGKNATSTQRGTTIKRVTMPDGTQIDKQIADFNDEDKSVSTAKKQAEFE